MTSRCYFCQAPATRLCDTPMKNSKGFYSIEAGTCDKPICDDCTTEDGITFDMYEPGGIDTIDRCPFHTEEARRLIHLV